jgi:Na+-driven multidrug efflux pump
MTASSIRRLAAAAALALVLAAPVTAQACPLCKYANEANQENEEVNRRPKAYMYSILFMLSMPATVLSTFSFGFYRVWKKHQLIVGDQPMPGDDLEV